MWTDRPAMTIAVDLGRQTTKQTNKSWTPSEKIFWIHTRNLPRSMTHCGSTLTEHAERPFQNTRDWSDEPSVYYATKVFKMNNHKSYMVHYSYLNPAEETAFRALGASLHPLISSKHLMYWLMIQIAFLYTMSNPAVSKTVLHVTPVKWCCNTR